MTIFQKSVIKRHLDNLDKEQVEKAYQKFRENYSPARIEKIKHLKEEEYQDGFLRDLFVDVFGYTLKPDDNYNLVREFKNQGDGKKADGAIVTKGNASLGDKAVAVIELKSTRTKDLRRITEQAFNYKNNQPGCQYVITSNFQKLRFYIDYANEYEEFDLFNLLKENFKLLYLLLSANSIFSNLPLKLKEETRFHEQDISDKLYKDYSAFKNKLFENLIRNNPDNDKLTLFKKSQKLLDRFLFILFAEDSGLLPLNSVSRIVDTFRKLTELDAYKPIYDIYKQYFGYMNIGRKGKTNTDDIPAYNGGLFYTDDLLDSLKIDDEILIDDLLRLSEYDFNTEVDVNILGHIFEHSLSENEEITAKLLATTRGHVPLANVPLANVPLANVHLANVPLANVPLANKRKKDGIFYTPKYITQYIVENTIGTLCNEKRVVLEIEEIEFDGTYRTKGGNLSAKGKKLYQKLSDYKDWLLSLKVVDPACGSGAFLNQALNFLIQEHKNIDDIIAELTNTALRLFDTEKSILENNLFGVDINEESVEIAKLSLWLRTAQKGRKLSVLSNNIKCGNSLIDDHEVAGDKAFNWNKEFPQVFREKKKKAWHVTTAIHNSRYSQRMFDYHIKTGDASWLSEEDEIIITEIIAEIVKEDNLNVVEYNICGDHMHLLLVCEEEELTKIVGKIKAKSGRKYNIEHGITKVATSVTRGHVPLSSGDVPLSSGDVPLSGSDTEKKKYNSLWTQKFGRSKIKDEKYLNNAINYIRNNRIKHKLPRSERIEKIKKEFLCSKDHAFRTEYTGGFDVVIGNPPYVQVNKYKKYYSCNYQTSACSDLYVYFIEKGISLLRKKGVFSFITPSLYIKGLRYETLREFLLKEVDIIEILDKGDGVFQEVQMPTAILTLVNAKETKQNWNDFIPGYSIISRLEQNSLNISDFSKIKRGLEIGKDKVYKNGNGVEILTGENISRYFIKDKSLISDETYSKYKKDEYYFNGNRVVIRETGNRLTSIFTNENIQQNRSLYSIKIEDGKISYLFLLSLINSKLIQYYYKAKFAANTDIFPKIRIAQVKNIPIKGVSKDHQQPFIEKADRMLLLNKQLLEKKNKFLNRLKDNIGATAPNKGINPLGTNSPDANPLGTPSILRLTKRLGSFYNYDFQTFIAELKKQKVKLSLIQQDEWEEYFTAYKNEINRLQGEIDKTDKEIDQMVYELYGLTEEEIKMVEGSFK